MKLLVLNEEQQANQPNVPEVIDGHLVSWYNRTIIDTWLKTRNFKACSEAIKGNYKPRAIKKILQVPWIQAYIRSEMRRREMATKPEIQNRFAADVDGFVFCIECGGDGKVKQTHLNSSFEVGIDGVPVATRWMGCMKCSGTGKIEYRLDDGQRDSLKGLAKVSGLLSDNVTNVGFGMTFDVRQGNGQR